MNSWRGRCLASRQVYPLLGFGRFYGSVHDHLGLRSFVEARVAGTLASDGVDEFPGLIVAERHQRIALAGITRRAGPGIKLLGNLDRLQAWAADLARLELIN